MGSRKSSKDTKPRRAPEAGERLLEVLAAQLAAKDRQIARLQDQLQLLLDEKFYRPELPEPAPAQALPPPLYDSQDVTSFDEAGDGSQYDTELRSIAAEHAGEMKLR